MRSNALRLTGILAAGLLASTAAFAQSTGSTTTGGTTTGGTGAPGATTGQDIDIRTQGAGPLEGAAVITEQDRTFAKMAAQSNLAEVALAEVAEDKDDLPPSVQGFAEAMKNDHGKAQQQLETLASDLDIELPEEPIEVYPGLLGGVESPLAFANGVIYAAVLNFSHFMSATGYEFTGEGYEKATGNLTALDGATGEILWDVEIPSGIAGVGPVVANDAIFVGTLDGIVRAFNTADGSEIWRVQTSAGLNAPFAVAGDTLYVPAGSFLVPSVDSPSEMPGVHAALIAFQLGATGTVTMGEAAPASPTASPEAAAAGNGTAVNVSAIDIAFEQKQLAIAADTDVTITLTNNGVLQHDLVIEGTDYATDLLDSGESAELIVNLPAGEYAYFCSVPGHREAGMQGTLTVG